MKIPHARSVPSGVVVVALAATLGDGCSSAEADDVGVVQIALTSVPSDVHCINVTAEGSRTVTRSFDVVPGAGTTLPMAGIPVGTIVFSGTALANACAPIGSNVTTWTADVVIAQVTSAAITNITLIMHPNGKARVSVDFQGDCVPLGLPCTDATGCCSGACVGAAGGNPGICQASCSPDGAACTNTAACCSGTCVGTDGTSPGVCQAATICGPAGAVCTRPTDCCSGSCLTTGGGAAFCG